MLDAFRGARLRRRKPAARSLPRARRPTLEGLECRVVPAPVPPTGLLASGISASAISLSWNAVKDPTVSGYDVYSKVWHSPGGASRGGGHYVYTLLAANLTAPSDTITGLATGSTHAYVVTALNSTGQSVYSLPASAETWVAPTFANGPNGFLLSSGSLFSGIVNATQGLTTQVSLLVNGNPLKYSIVSGPSGVSIDPKTGVVSYTPTSQTLGTASATFMASNALGSITQTIQFDVAAGSSLPKPTLKLSSQSGPFNGSYQNISAMAVGKDGVTPVAGGLVMSFDGGKGANGWNAGTLTVLLTFTSANPNYGNATLVTTYTITPGTPTFNYLTSPTIAAGTASTTITGYVWSVAGGIPVGDYVFVTINGVSEAATLSASGYFSATFATGSLPVGKDTITYSFPGDANFRAGSTTSTLTVIPTAPPRITQNPTNVTVSAGDGATFTVAATGVPAPTYQWQVSTDGGVTFTNITGNASALTATLNLGGTYTSESGYKYRAVVTNSVGVAISSVATLIVQSDSGGGDSGGGDS